MKQEARTVFVSTNSCFVTPQPQFRGIYWAKASKALTLLRAFDLTLLKSTNFWNKVDLDHYVLCRQTLNKKTNSNLSYSWHFYRVSICNSQSFKA